MRGRSPPHKGGPNRPDRPTAVVSGQWLVVSGWLQETEQGSEGSNFARLRLNLELNVAGWVRKRIFSGFELFRVNGAYQVQSDGERI